MVVAHNTACLLAPEVWGDALLNKVFRQRMVVGGGE